MINGFEVIAHRGFSKIAPENTLSAFEAAYYLGVDMVELDIQMSADNELIVIHDATVNRTTNGKGEIKAKNYPLIKKLDAGTWFNPEFAPEKVPLLKDVIAWAIGKVRLLIEVKPKFEKMPLIPNLLVDMIKGLNAQEWCIIQSFDYEMLFNIKALAPNLEYYQLYEEYEALPVDFAPFIKAANPSFTSIEAPFIKAAHQKGVKVYPYTVNNPTDMKRMINMEVDGIITDSPDILKQIINDS